MKETLKNYICEICGGELKETEAGHFQCPYCHAEFFKETKLPDELVLDLHSAGRARTLQRFEDALNEYDRIIASYGDCFDAYWGATLSDYGIQYEKDYDGRMIPTVHRFSETSVFENRYYVNAVKYCKDERELNRIKASAEEIERIRTEIEKTVGVQESYDIFLCYKETSVSNPKDYTPEFYWADELYRRLRGDGYKVFFAKESLPAAKGDYEAHIFPALSSSKLMLILTTSLENVESVWVKNEWSRFVRFSKENPSAGKRFKVIMSGFKPEGLPRELKKEQVLNHDSMGWVEQLYKIIKDTFRDREKEDEERRRREADELEARITGRLEEERRRWAAEELKRREEGGLIADTENNNPSAGTYVEQQLDDGFFEGYIKDGVLLKGTLKYKIGNLFEGAFENGRPASGKMTYKNGDVYEGEFDEYGAMHGKGKMTYENGAVYEGDFKDGCMQGNGKLVFANGNIYEGEFFKDKLHGKGKIFYNNPEAAYSSDEEEFYPGNVYEGYFFEDFMQGSGKMTYKNGNVYDGEWLRDQKFGYGKMTYKSGVIYEGDWSYNYRHGNAKLIFINGDVFQTKYEHDESKGKGVMTFANGKTAKGKFVDGMFKKTLF